MIGLADAMAVRCQSMPQFIKQFLVQSPVQNLNLFSCYFTDVEKFSVYCVIFNCDRVPLFNYLCTWMCFLKPCQVKPSRCTAFVIRNTHPFPFNFDLALSINFRALFIERRTVGCIYKVNCISGCFIHSRGLRLTIPYSTNYKLTIWPMHKVSCFQEITSSIWDYELLQGINVPCFAFHGKHIHLLMVVCFVESFISLPTTRSAFHMLIFDVSRWILYKYIVCRLEKIVSILRNFFR